MPCTLISQVRAKSAGVHEHVDAPELRHRVRDGFPDLLVIGYVELLDVGGDALGAERLGRLAERLLVAVPEDGFGALAAQPLRNAQPDARPTARHDRHLVLEPLHHRLVR
jgi:hypothetical protein